MLIPDVLALPLSEAIARLEAAGIQYTVTVSQPPRQRAEDIEGRVPTEYVVRQQLLDNDKIAIVTVKRYRKEVLEDGICNQ
ncbi:aliphatic sulfonate ABC transporter [uncultured Phascolarctobacterium sp.]|uniref:aliphatic sulfonate ABC transporter n=1 Tax=uncultured Phascolarctobacterium sp. TaxID=512296 RepID=UPI0015A9DAE6|nr:aliphatic sulfonate ABC transporter [uncultured Phascolarctobacterium sp.]